MSEKNPMKIPINNVNYCYTYSTWNAVYRILDFDRVELKQKQN